jgi:large subunit ribosomal protein L10
MNREQKAAVIDEVATQIEEADAIFAVDYRGLSVRQSAELRSRLIDVGTNLRVVKNTLTERAADKAGHEELKTYLEGPTAFAFVTGDVAVAAKVLATFRRETKLPEFKGGIMGPRELSIDEIETIAKLPATDVLYGQLVGMVAAPITGLARGLNAMLSGIAIALGQIQEKGLLGEGAAEAAPPSAETEQPAEEPAEEPAEQPAEQPAEEPAEEPADDTTSETE